MLPDSALDADIAIIGKKGAGKTVAARGMVERLLDAGRRVVVLDPLASWWGLKARADGAPGYPVTVIGGPHGDVAIDPKKGAALGVFVAQSAAAFVIDTSELRRPEMLGFVGEFLAALYALNREALWLVLEEADYYSPQSPTREAAPLAYEIDQISRRGRARGFRLWSITQRPAKLAKDVLSQASSLIVMKLMAPQDRRAVEDWLAGNVGETAETAVDSLPGLQVGEGWLWNPELGLLQRERFPKARTLDTSFTPDPAGMQLARPDLAALRRAVALPPPLRDPAAIRAEAYAKGRADGERAERAKLRGVLTAALEALQEAEAATLAEQPAEAAQEPPPPPDLGPKTNDEVQREILGKVNAPQRRLLEAVLEHGELRRDDLARRAGLARAPAAFADNLEALKNLELVAFEHGRVRPTARLFPLGIDHR